MIRLEDVSKVYHTSDGDVRALDHLSLEVAEGEFVAVRGPSGCGKTTLLTLVGALATPTSGKVLVAGNDVANMTAHEREQFRARTIGFVFQMFHLFPYLNVVENVVVAALPGQEAAARARAGELLERFQLGHRLKHRPEQLSIGERQRVAIARALLNQPQLLLADEPTGNLDPENGAAVLELLGDFHRGGGTVLLVTHEQAAADRAQRTILLEEGRLRAPLSASS